MADDNAIIIPITISTEESQDIKKLIEELKKVEHIPDQKQQQRKSKRFKSATGAPIQREYEETGPLFSGEQQGYAFPDQTRDRTSKQAVKTNQQFKKLQKDVIELRSKVLDKGAGKISEAAALFANPSGFLMGFLTKFAPVIGPLLVAKGAFDAFINELTRDGGILDRRFKRNISKEVSPMFEREYKAEIAAGLREVRITSYPGERQRGKAGVMSTQMYMKVGKPIYDTNLDNISKGIQ